MSTDIQAGLGLAASSTSLLSSDVSVADLVRELQETNRLLRTMASQTAVGHPAARELLGIEPLSPPLGESVGAETRVPSTPELHTAREKARRFVDELAHAALDSADRGHLNLFRDETLSLMTRAPAPQTSSGRTRGYDKFDPREQVRLVLGFRGQRGQKSEVLWNWRTSTAAGSQPLGSQPLAVHEIDEIRHQWPVRFDLESWTQSISRDSGWILGKNPRQFGVLCALTLVSLSLIHI